MKEFLLIFSSLFGPGLSFVLYATVIIAGIRFIKEGTVGQMTSTFYTLGSFNGCVWAIYSVLIGSKTIAIPNAFSLLATSFAFMSYFSVLRRELKQAEEKLAASPHDAPSVAAEKSQEMRTIPPSAAESTNPTIAEDTTQKSRQTTSNSNNTAVISTITIATTSTTTSASTIKIPNEKENEARACQLSPLPLSEETVATTNGTGNSNSGDGCPSASCGVTRTNSSTAVVSSTQAHASYGAIDDVTLEEERQTPEEHAAELRARYDYTKKSASIILGANVLTCLVILAVYGMGYVGAAIAMSGTMGVVMENILFTGPLDEISWILKHKNSSPLDPLMTFVGAVDCAVWIIYATLTSDVYLFIPNAFSATLCVIQLGLIWRFPARAV